MHHCLMVESRHSVEVMLLCVRGELHLVYGRKVVSSLKFQRMYGMVTTISAPGISLAVNSLQVYPLKCDIISKSSVTEQLILVTKIYRSLCMFTAIFV